MENNFSFCKDMFEKSGELRQFHCGECFVHSGDMMEYVGWIVSGGFKLSLTASNGIDNTIGFALADSILINNERVMYIKEILWTISFLRTMDSNKLKGFFYPGNAVSGELIIDLPRFFVRCAEAFVY